MPNMPSPELWIRRSGIRRVDHAARFFGRELDAELVEVLVRHLLRDVRVAVGIAAADVGVRARHLDLGDPRIDPARIGRMGQRYGRALLVACRDVEDVLGVRRDRQVEVAVCRHLDGVDSTIAPDPRLLVPVAVGMPRLLSSLAKARAVAAPREKPVIVRTTSAFGFFARAVGDLRDEVVVRAIHPRLDARAVNISNLPAIALGPVATPVS